MNNIAERLIHLPVYITGKGQPFGHFSVLSYGNVSEDQKRIIDLVIAKSKGHLFSEYQEAGFPVIEFVRLECSSLSHTANIGGIVKDEKYRLVQLVSSFSTAKVGEIELLLNNNDCLLKFYFIEQLTNYTPLIPKSDTK